MRNRLLPRSFSWLGGVRGGGVLPGASCPILISQITFSCMSTSFHWPEGNIRIPDLWSSLAAQWVKDPVLPLPRLWSLLWHGFYPCPGTSTCHRSRKKKKKKKKSQTWTSAFLALSPPPKLAPPTMFFTIFFLPFLSYRGEWERGGQWASGNNCGERAESRV